MKTWLITGCSSGLGKSLAKTVLERGDQAVVTARSPETLRYFEERFPDTALIAALDVTDQAAIDRTAAAALERFGSIDVLVNNAGYGYRAAVEEGIIAPSRHRSYVRLYEQAKAIPQWELEKNRNK